MSAVHPATRRDLFPAIEPWLGWTLAFGFAFATMAVFLFAHRDIAFRGDAAEIWEIARHYYDPGRVPSLFEYRGPFAFVLYNLLQRLATVVGLDPTDAFRLLSATCFASIGSLLLPGLAAAILGKRARWTHAVPVSLATFYFFRGYFLHPQVDILALTFFLAAVRLLVVTQGDRRRLVACAAASALFVFSIWTRFNYVVALPFLLAALAIDARARGETRGRIAGRVLLFGLAPIVVLLATAAPTERSPQDKVLIMQLTMGLKVQKVEWNAENPRFPGAVEVPDPVGAGILRRLTPAETAASGRPHWVTPAEYAGAVARDPLAFATLWAKHLFNGLDVWYESVYVRDLYRGRLLRSTLNFLLLAIAAVALWRRRVLPHGFRWREALTAFAIAAPALSVVPFVIEVRFFLPLLAFAHAVAIVDARETLQYIRVRRLYVPILVVVVLAMLLSLETSDSAGIHVLLGPD